MNEKLVKALRAWFENEQWQIVIEDNRVVALMSSGYGSGPSEIDITSLAKFLERELCNEQV